METNSQYAEKQVAGKGSEKVLMRLAWKVKELTDVNEYGRKLYTDLTSLIERLKEKRCNWSGDNIPRHLTNVRERLLSFIRRVTRHKRVAATHILVFMISTED